MTRIHRRSGLAVVAAFGMVLTGSAAASAQPQQEERHDQQRRSVSVVELDELNDSGVHGFGTIRLDGNEASVRLYTYGALEDQPHAQHVHIGGEGKCPTRADDADGDGIVSTAEGAQDYGGIGVSLTTEGDTSPDSGLAVDRFPTAPNGFVRYSRTVTVNDEVAANIRTGDAVLVQHGIDINGSGAYDGDAPSSLDPSLPLEATAPAACGSQNVRLSGSADRGLGLGVDLNS
ncbi:MULTISPECIES: hypothetical protein [unclassified Actinopolyspora]|uniref:hypothetical protein n=1 Tax=unclassified Actinopolyspora TaxID=2639451 RepID=UPI0013F63B88|nr:MULTISPECIES: hypothetical protein [unclassified Actinopolyspora]NHD18052.1 hypothetical protein [Actinopolyspora sp. BKK2]NHE78625.1 hypothetical protein [Actinopolyspora sp. BKK1]